MLNPKTFAEWITVMKPQRIADDLNRPVGTIYAWSSENRIPRIVWPDLLLVYPELGLAQLMDMEIEAGRSR